MILILILLLLTTNGYADKWIVKKLDGTVINDFQSQATPETLVANTVNSLGGQASDYVTELVSDIQFTTLGDQVNAPARAIEAQRRAKAIADRNQAKAKLKSGQPLNDNDITVLFGD